MILSNPDVSTDTSLRAVQQNTSGKRGVENDPKKRLRSLESILRRADSAGLGAAEALYEIKSSKLFTMRGKTMKEYGRFWGYSPSHTYRLLACGKINRALTPLWEEGCPRPRTVWQLRPLFRLTEEQQCEAWRRATHENKSRPPTAEQVEKCVVEVTGGAVTKPLRRTSHKITLNLGHSFERRWNRLARERGLSAEALALDALRRYVKRTDRKASRKAFSASMITDLILMPQPNFPLPMLSVFAP